MHKALTQSFSTFLRQRRVKQHVERRPLPRVPAPQLKAKPPTAASLGALGQAPGQDLLAIAREEPAAALLRLQSRADGLDATEAACRLARGGANQLAHEKPLPGWWHLWRCYLNPFNLLLMALALLSFVSADATATVVIVVMVALSTVIRFVQEGRSHRAAEGLRAMASNTATVIRRAAATPVAGVRPANPPIATHAIPRRELVAGDVVALSAGDMTPADCRGLTARELFIAEAAMTGKPLPVEKLVPASPAGATSSGPLEPRTWCSWAPMSSPARPRARARRCCRADKWW